MPISIINQDTKNGAAIQFVNDKNRKLQSASYFDGTTSYKDIPTNNNKAINLNASAAFTINYCF